MRSRCRISGQFAVLAAWILWSGPVAGRAAETFDPKALAEVIRKATDVSAGLCVHLGCGEGGLTAELGRGSRLLVQGLEPDRGKLQAAREHIRAEGLYGRVSADACDLKSLPYVHNLVNLVVVDDLERVLVAGLSLQEMIRVLAPGGVAWVGQGGLSDEALRGKLTAAGIRDFTLVKQGGPWAAIRKPRPANMGEWTHNCRVGGDGNPVVKDSQVGVASSIQWMSGPVWPTGENVQEGNRGAVSAGGRNFSLTTHSAMNLRIDPAVREKSLCLVARDAFNGLVLWERKSGRWEHYGPSGPLLTDGARVYAFTRDKGPIAAFDAATGETVRTYEETAGAHSAILAGGDLLASAGGQLYCIRTDSGQVRWKRQGTVYTVFAGQGRVVCESGGVVCLDHASGQELWRKEGGGRLRCLSAGVIALLTDSPGPKATLTVRDLKDGSDRWSHPFTLSAYARGEPSIFIRNGCIWICEDAGKVGKDVQARWLALELADGQVKHNIKFKVPGNTNSGCIGRQWVFTDRFALGGHSMTYIDLESGQEYIQTCARGGCGVGYMAANGLSYTFPKDCGCYYGWVRGYVAWGHLPAPAGKPTDALGPERLQTGSARAGQAQAAPAGAEDWPTFRHDPQRSAFAPTVVPTEPKVLWETDLKCAYAPDAPLAADWLANPSDAGPLTQPVVVGETVYVSLTEAHQVAALDARTGKPRWTYTAGGRLDAPPTVHEGLVLAGCRDGWVYCLTAQDGRLVWRFRAAPQDRRIMAFGQLESAWPVVGGVAADKGMVYCFAGRSTQVDGGLWAYGLEVKTGKPVWRAQAPTVELASPDRYLCDMPVIEGDCVSMAGKWMLEAKTGAVSKKGPRPLQARNTAMDRAWHTAPLTTRAMGGQWGVYVWGNLGQALVAHPEMVIFYRWGAEAKSGVAELAARGKGKSLKEPPLWSVKMPGPAQVEAMVRAGEVVFAAGAADRLDRVKGGLLAAYSAANGRKLGESRLVAPPAAEGLAAAGGRLYLSTRDGRLTCWGK